jgi:hypothetical protein
LVAELSQRETDGECASNPFAALQTNCPAVLLDNLAHIGEPNPAAADSAHRVARPLETLEHTRLIIRWYADSLVVHRQ